MRSIAKEDDVKKGMTIDDYMKEIEAQKERVEVFRDVIHYMDNQIEWKCSRVVDTEGYYEEVTNEETGETERKWHSTVYKVDDDGEYIRIEPKEDDYNYKSFMALKKVREEILAII